MHENRSFLPALIIVALAAPAAALLVVVALVVWLAELMGSVIYPCLLLGVLFALLAYIIYKVSLREALREMEQRLQVISDAIALLRTGVEWCVQWLIRR